MENKINSNLEQILNVILRNSTRANVSNVSTNAQYDTSNWTPSAQNAVASRTLRVSFILPYIYNPYICMFEKISYRAAEWRLPPAFCLFLKAYFVANKPFTPSF